MGSLVPLLKLIRLPMVFTALADSAAGGIISGVAAPDRYALLGIVSASLYSFGMVLNDLIDAKRDRDLHPDRPLVTGSISRPFAVLVAGLLLIFAALAAGLLSQGSAVPAKLAGLLGFSVVAYNLVFKHLGVLGAVNMGLCRALNLALGFSLSPWGLEGVPFILTTYLYVMLVTCISLLEETPNWALFITLLLLLAIVPLGSCLAAVNPMGGVVSLLVLGWLVKSLPGTMGPGMIGKTVGYTLRLIIVLDASYAASMSHWLGAAVLLILLPFSWASFRVLKVVS